jgi:hypothetical protein
MISIRRRPQLDSLPIAPLDAVGQFIAGITREVFQCKVQVIGGGLPTFLFGHCARYLDCISLLRLGAVEPDSFDVLASSGFAFNLDSGAHSKSARTDSGGVVVQFDYVQLARAL